MKTTMLQRNITLDDETSITGLTISEDRKMESAIAQLRRVDIVDAIRYYGVFELLDHIGVAEIEQYLNATRRGMVEVVVGECRRLPEVSGSM